MKHKEIKIVHIFGGFVFILGILSIIIIIGASQVEKTVIKMQDSTTQYIVEERSISQMREVSDYLTESCQSFISTGNIKEAKAYFKEINVDQHREGSLKTVEQYGKDDPIYVSLADALASSNDLAETEVYAMRLAAEGYNIDPADISDELVSIELSNEDQQLGSSEKRQKGRNMVFDDNYINKKNEIWNSVTESTETLMNNASKKEMDYYNDARRIILIQSLLLLLLLVLALILLIAVARMVIMPLRASGKYIRNNTALPLRGAAEYQYLARAYNGMLEETQKHHEILSYEATHDEMTSLYNRKFFEMKREELSGEEIALMIVDVDYFKSVNDTYGHEIGDKVLKKVSDILASSFRSGDFVCRIGGDEFAVLMVRMRPELKHIIEEKIENINQRLKENGDGLPAVTLSIGVAFSTGSDDIADSTAVSPEKLFKNADLALYNVKEAGRNGYAFY